MAREGLTPINLQGKDRDHLWNLRSVINAFKANGAPVGVIRGHTLISDPQCLDIIWEAVGQVRQRLSSIEGIERMDDLQVGVLRRIAAHEVTDQILTNIRDNSSH